jgi:hypothetical protein
MCISGPESGEQVLGVDRKVEVGRVEAFKAVKQKLKKVI